MRKIIDFNNSWLFAKNAQFPDTVPGEGWEEVSLPHTWNAVDGQDGGNDYWRGTAMYAKAFPKPAISDGEKLFLEIPGAAMTAEVVLNGKSLIKHEGGYSLFRVELTESLLDENLLCICVDNSANDRIYPQMADFTFYGGLYRGARLITVPSEHFELEKDGTPAIKVTPVVDLEKGSASVCVEVWHNSAKAEISVNGERKNVVSEDGCSKAEFVIENVRLWDGVNDPYLYTAEARLESGDCVSAEFGCRVMEFSPEKGFILNGKEYPLRGVSRHQDRRGLGNALSLKEHVEDISLIIEMGANTVRLAHYQHAQEFYTLCDRMGLIVWAEIPYISKHMPNGRQNTLDQMRELICQCYNHPSICCWGLSNEITAASSDKDEDLIENHRLLNELCHSMDKTRPTTMAHVFMLETDSELINIADIGSYNLYFGWYIGELEQNDSFFDEYHEKHPDRVIGFSEYGADANPRFYSDSPEKGDYSVAFQCKYHEHILNMIEKRPYLWATHVWNMFDFAADGRDEGGEHGVNQKGLVTMDRQTKKDTFYLYKAAWNKTDKFVHLCFKDFPDRCGDSASVKVYSNCGSVSLFVDGKLFEEKQSDRVFDFTVPISGEHEIKAVSGELCDRMTLHRVIEPNKDYLFVKETVVNWFDKEELNPDCFSINDTLGELMSNPMSGAIVGRMMEAAAASRGDVATGTKDNANLQKMLARMSLASLLKQAGDAIKPEQIKALNTALQKIKKKKEVRLELTLDSQLRELLAHRESRELLDKMLPGVSGQAAAQPFLAGFSLRKMLAMGGSAVPAAVGEMLEKELSALNIMVDPDSVKKYFEDRPVLEAAAEKLPVEKKNCIVPGAVMRDTEGKRIQAHGGAVIFDNGAYYLYGENKDRTDGKCPVWTWGIRAYRSIDLYNWEDLGLIIKPELDDPKSGLYPEKHLDRPHIFKNSKTGKYICWIKQSGDEACFIILSAPALLGPWSVERSEYRPDGIKVGDFDISPETGDGRRYMYMDCDHKGVGGFLLSEDGLSAEKQISMSYPDMHAPFTREGVTVFERNGIKHMLTSGMTGYVPNRSDSAAAACWEDEFVSAGDPHADDSSRASFNSQISQVFKVEGKKDLYISIADRWVPGYPVDAKLADIFERSIAARFEPDKYSATPEEMSVLMSSPMLESANTSVADYVWLPLRFEGDCVKIDWLPQWCIEDYE